MNLRVRGHIATPAQSSCVDERSLLQTAARIAVSAHSGMTTAAFPHALLLGFLCLRAVKRGEGKTELPTRR